MSSKYDHSPPMLKPWKATAPVKHQTCQYMTSATWPGRCGAPSHGRTYCEDCRNASMAAAPKFFGGLTRRGADA